MTVLNGFTRPADPIGGDLGPRIAASIGKTVDSAWVSPTDVFVSGPALVAGDKPAIQTFLTGYAFDGSWGLPLRFVFSLNGIPADPWTNMPAALSEMSNSRVRLPLYGVSYIRITTNVGTGGAAAAILMVRASIDNGTTWTTVTNSPQVAVNTTGFKVSALVAVPANFQTDVMAAVWGQGGDGVADPTFGLTTVQGF